MMAARLRASEPAGGPANGRRPERRAAGREAEAVDGSFRPAALLMSGRLLGFAASFFIPMVLARAFSQAEFGTYKQLFLLYATLNGIAQIGMAESLFYFLPKTPQHAGRYVANSLLALAASGLVCFILLWALGSSLSGWLSNGELSGQIPLIGAYLLLMLTSAGLEIVMIARRRHLGAAGAYAFSDLLRAALMILPVLWMGGLQGLLWGAVAFAAVRLGGTLAYLRGEFPGTLRPDGARLKEQLAYALPFEMSVLAAVLQSNFHSYAVSYYFNAATFAVYAVGCLQVPLVDFLGSSAGNVMMVRMTEAIREGRRGAVLALWRDTTRKLTLVFFPLVGVLWVNARDIIVFLFTERYLASVPVFRLWIVFTVLACLQTDSVLRVYAQTRFLLLLYGVRLLLVAALIKGFLAAFDLPGAVLVTLVAACVAKVWGLARMKSLLDVSLARLLPWKSMAGMAVAAAAASLPALAIRSVLEVPTWALLSVTGSVYAAAYLALVFASGLLGGRERLAVAGWVRRWRNSRARNNGATDTPVVEVEASPAINQEH